jgi:tRNA(Glu) U13 pseudouridine synthase TruD
LGPWAACVTTCHSWTELTFFKIPRSLRTMYVHAYQSYIWNLVATARINLSRTGPLVGDLVFEDGGDDEGELHGEVPTDII